MMRGARSILVLALALAAALTLPGCALRDAFRGEGQESVTLTNASGQALSVVVILEQDEGGIRLLGEEIFLENGQTERRDVTMKPGGHTLRLTTSTSIAETMRIAIPEKGDTDLTVTIFRGKATLTVTER